MISFALRGRVADLDETTADEPWHPAVVLLLEVDESFCRVIVPSSVLNGRRERFCSDSFPEDSVGQSRHCVDRLRRQSGEQYWL